MGIEVLGARSVQGTIPVPLAIPGRPARYLQEDGVPRRARNQSVGVRAIVLAHATPPFVDFHHDDAREPEPNRPFDAEFLPDRVDIDLQKVHLLFWKKLLHQGVHRPLRNLVSGAGALIKLRKRAARQRGGGSDHGRAVPPVSGRLAQPLSRDRTIRAIVPHK